MENEPTDMAEGTVKWFEVGCLPPGPADRRRGHVIYGNPLPARPNLWGGAACTIEVRELWSHVRGWLGRAA
jgi:hypothetical protein